MRKGHLLICLALLSLALPSRAVDVTMGWNLSPETNLAAYVLRYGLAGSGVTKQLVIATNAESVVVSNLTAQGAYTFALTAKNISGLESPPSNQVLTNLPGTNNAPSGTPLSLQTGEDQLLPVTLSGLDPDGNELSYQIVSNPGHGWLSGIPPNLTYTPAANYAGPDAFTFLASDGVSNSAPATVSIMVDPVNDPPTLAPINSVSLNEDAPLQTVSLTGIGAGGGESQTLTVTASSSNPGVVPHPTVSYVSPNPTGSLSFTPVPNANGAATITVTVNDGGSSNNTVSRSFTVTVAAVNDPPTLAPLTNLVLLEDAGWQTVALSGISSGAANENQTLTVSAISNNPQLIPNPTVSYSSPNSVGTLTFISATNASGSATITVTVDDGQTQNHSIARNFTVTVTAVNDVPTLTSIADQTLLQNTSTDPIPFEVDDAETPAGSLVVSAASSNPTLLPASGITLGGVGGFRTLKLTPAQNQTGLATVRVAVSDGGSSRTNAFTLTVNHGNYAPTLNPVSDLTINEDATGVMVPLSGIGSGATNESQVLVITAASSNPALIPDPPVSYTSPSASASLQIDPVHNASGTALITVTVSDGGSENNEVTRQFSVTVTPENDAPSITAIADQVTETGRATGSLAFSIDDVDSPLTTLQVTAISSNAVLLPQTSIALGGSGTQRTIKLAPAPGLNGQSLITLAVTDGSLSTTTSFLLTVTPTNHPPILSAIADQAMPAYTTLSGLGFTVQDLESPASALSVTATSSSQGLLPNTNIVITGSGTNRTLTLSPLPGKQGVLMVTVAVSDGQWTARASFQLTVQAAPAPQSTLTVLTQGSGSVTPNLNGQPLVVGAIYTLTAVPEVGCIFTGWSGGLTSGASALRFAMTSNLVLRAGFMTNPFTPVAGLYNGLFYEEDEVAPGRAGFFTLKTTAQGAYSGKVLLGKKPLRVSGQLDFTGRGTSRIVRQDTNSLTLEFQLANLSGGGTVEGRLTDGEWEAVLLGDRTGYAKTNPAPFAGSYTLIVPGAADPADGPEGHGYGTVRIDAAGVATFAGSLADGSKVSQKVALSREGAWPLYAGLYAGNGFLLSWQAVTNRASDDIHGRLSWIRPAQPLAKFWPLGFAHETITVGSSYVRPGPTNRVVDLVQATIVFAGGNLASTVTNLIALDPPNRISASGGLPLSLSISSASGLFSGKMTEASGKSAIFRGAVLQKQGGGAGFLLGTNRSAQVFFGW